MQISTFKARVLQNVTFAVGGLFYAYYTYDYKKTKYYEKHFSELSESNLDKIWPVFCDACKKCEYDPQNLRLVSWDQAMGKYKQDPGVICVPDSYFNNFDNIFQHEKMSKWTTRLVRHYDNLAKNAVIIGDEELSFILAVEIERLKKIEKEWTPFFMLTNGLIAYNIVFALTNLWIVNIFVGAIAMSMTEVTFDILQARAIDDKLLNSSFGPTTAYTSIDCQKQIVHRLELVDPSAYFKLPTHHRSWFLESRMKRIYRD